MNNTVSKRLYLTAMVTPSVVVYTTSAFAETSKLVIESGDSAQSRQEAAMEKEQWNDTRSLRQKVNGNPIPCSVWIVVQVALLCPDTG